MVKLCFQQPEHSIICQVLTPVQIFYYMTGIRQVLPDERQSDKLFTSQIISTNWGAFDNVQYAGVFNRRTGVDVRSKYASTNFHFAFL